MSETEHPVHIPFKATDHASGVIGKISHHVGELGKKVDESVSKLMEMGSAVAGIGGALGFERMVESGKESLEQLSKMAKLTGTSAQNVAALRDTFEQSGLSAEAMATTITRLGKNSLRLEEGGKQLAAEAKRWGVNLKEGPVKAILTMSEAVKKHKMGEAEVQKLTGMSRENLGGMMELLEQGPEELAKTVEEAKKLNVHLGDPNALAQFKKFHEASVKIHETFRRISEKVVIALAPALTKMADKFSHWIETIDVHKFVDPLVHGMQLAVTHAKLLGKIMLANAILNRTTGGGILSGGMGAAKGVYGIGARIGGAIGGMGMGGVGGILAPIMRVVGGLTGLGLVAGAIYLIIKHLDYFKNKLAEVGHAIYASIQKLWAVVGNLFSENSAIGKFARWIGDKFMKLVQFLGSLIAKFIGWIADAIQWVSDAVTALSKGESISKVRADRSIAQSEGKKRKYDESGFSEYLAGGSKQAEIIALAKATGAVTEAQRRMFEEYAKRYAATGADESEAFLKMKARYGRSEAPEASEAPKMGVYQDFRNSRFDITQKFAEGFDPDRIAVGFANDIAGLGEKKLQSGFAPLYSIR